MKGHFSRPESEFPTRTSVTRPINRFMPVSSPSCRPSTFCSTAAQIALESSCNVSRRWPKEQPLEAPYTRSTRALSSIVFMTDADKIRLRLATSDDAERLLQWRNQPFYLRNSTSQAPVTLEEHQV